MDEVLADSGDWSEQNMFFSSPPRAEPLEPAPPQFYGPSRKAREGAPKSRANSLGGQLHLQQASLVSLASLM